MKLTAVIDFTEIKEADKAEQDLLDEIVLRDEKKKILNDAVCSLSDDMRVVIHLVYFEELSYEQIAIILNKNKKQIYNIISRAKIILKQKLKTEVYDENN